jgi:hypothetical protein
MAGYIYQEKLQWETGITDQSLKNPFLLKKNSFLLKIGN